MVRLLALFICFQMGQSSSTTISQDAVSAVQSMIQSNKVMIFSKTYCPYCSKAKKYISQCPLKTPAQVEELDNNANGDSWQAALHSITGVRTVPQVFINGQFIGGGDDTERLFKSGELQEKLRAAGAI
eukprot:TRINITY_DN9580_c0_g1_i4.p1 TRINITY_DN9580_c0_g1~~TRINITY_DN9580_c0_g1_i4.p1  ORF type:complete len:128 (+),score=17.18 TRINITY_DN9580_c0_g1_i4:176-559(+)